MSETESPTIINANGAWPLLIAELSNTVPQKEMDIWLKPIEAQCQGKVLILYVPNAFFANWVKKNYLPQIEVLRAELTPTIDAIFIEVGVPESSGLCEESVTPKVSAAATIRPSTSNKHFVYESALNQRFNFDNFVEGKSNQLARAAAKQVAANPGTAYNPLFFYGGVGLGKTHLMQAIGNLIVEDDSSKKVVYLHSERFVADMVKALQDNTIGEFKQYYRSLDALLIDDIQFFAGKDRSQEEFFHTFNALLEGHKQVIMTCDCYPKEINGLEDRLKSRFGWGLTVAIEPPELETRVAILINKAHEAGIELKQEVAFFIAKRIRSNVRELEGALKRVMASAKFGGYEITIEFTRDALKDLISLQNKLITLPNIQKMVAEYYKIKVSDLTSKSRSRSVTRPRQVAMYLAKEMTNHSLPEIGEAFGGRDHTTVLHACRTIKNLIGSSSDIAEDTANLTRLLST